MTTAPDTLAPRDRALIIRLIATFVVILNETIMPNLRDNDPSDVREIS